MSEMTHAECARLSVALYDATNGHLHRVNHRNALWLVKEAAVAIDQWVEEFRQGMKAERATGVIYSFVKWQSELRIREGRHARAIEALRTAEEQLAKDEETRRILWRDAESDR